MTAIFSAAAAVTLVSVGSSIIGSRKARKQQAKFQREERRRIQEQADQARVAASLDRERTDEETANIQDQSSEPLVSTGKRKYKPVNSGNISSSLGL